MLLLCMMVLISAAASHRVVERVEDIGPTPNTTTLYPVTPNTTNQENNKIKSATSWKIETTFGASKLDGNTLETNSTESKEQLVEAPAPGVNSSQEFRPSPHLGSVEEFQVVPTRNTDADFNAVIRKPPTGFISSSKENYKSAINKFPKELFKNYQEFPYKIEPAILTRAKDGWKPTGTLGSSPSTPGGAGTLESRPTAEVPVRVPAGGLYQLPDPFRDKPGDDFGLDFSGDYKEHGVKKRINPMKNLLALLTALIPVGIIFSALSPNVITIQPDQQLPGNVFRRADGSVSQLPPISERCRRRLLCELRNDHHYDSSGRRKPCHRLHCEDPEALERTLHWLLSHRRPHPTAGPTGDHFT